MADIDSKMTLYDFNKVAMAKELKMSSLQIEMKKPIIIDYINSQEQSRYFMLLCNEEKNYTLFNLTHKENWSAEIVANDVIECMRNRGNLLAIDLDNNGAVALWIRKQDEEICCYYFFSYDNGVIEY